MYMVDLVLFMIPTYVLHWISLYYVSIIPNLNSVTVMKVITKMINRSNNKNKKRPVQVRFRIRLLESPPIEVNCLPWIFKKSEGRAISSFISPNREFSGVFNCMLCRYVFCMHILFYKHVNYFLKKLTNVCLPELRKVIICRKAVLFLFEKLGFNHLFGVDHNTSFQFFILCIQNNWL